jgi:hypothetical protein
MSISKIIYWGENRTMPSYDACPGITYYSAFKINLGNLLYNEGILKDLNKANKNEITSWVFVQKSTVLSV